MTLAEALQILNAAKGTGSGELFDAALACGFTPLHLQTFFQAHLQTRLEGRLVKIHGGLFGDLIGTVEALPAGLHAAAVAVEWADLDARLGFRQLGGWKPAQMPDLVAGFERRMEQLESAVRAAAARFPVAVVFPALRLPPAFVPVNAKSSGAALALRACVAACAARLAGVPGISIVNQEELDRLSPPAARHDLRSDLLTGFPFSSAHAEAAGSLLADALLPRAPKKGLITDLDDTLWAGIVGEIGPQAVSWDLEHHSQLHGLYQQVLDSLALQGVLLGVASKNDPAVVEQVWRERGDLLVPRDRIYPREVHWGPKSESVGRILKTWNIAADSVVFIDDSPLEVAEVQAAFPAIQCVAFPKNDPAAALALFYRLRELFGKDRIEADDAIRLESIRRAGDFREQAESPGERQEDFLKGLEATITVSINPPLPETRVLELVNKTNQFNLNGIRYDAAAWRRMQSGPGTTTLALGYRDKFGPLGTIAVIHGNQTGRCFRVSAWVMSCRAFSRRIEHAALQFLIDQCGVERFVFAFESTAKNGPTRAFLAHLTGSEPAGEVALEVGVFRAHCPALSQRLEIKTPEAAR
jgi:FkbH-like protein